MRYIQSQTKSESDVSNALDGVEVCAPTRLFWLVLTCSFPFPFSFRDDAIFPDLTGLDGNGIFWGSRDVEAAMGNVLVERKNWRDSVRHSHVYILGKSKGYTVSLVQYGINTR